MAKKTDNVFSRAKAYRAEHPRVSFQDAIQRVKGKKVSGTVKRTAPKKAKVQGVKRPRIIGAVKVSKAKPADRNLHLLKLGQIIKGRIAAKELELKKVKDKDERRLLIGFINGEHDKLDKVINQMKQK